MTKLATWATRHPERLAATKAVQAAVKSDRLVQSLVCESCGQLRARRRRLDAHHEDYSKPLSVTLALPAMPPRAPQCGEALSAHSFGGRAACFVGRSRSCPPRSSFMATRERGAE
jgi:hypothetical protein